MTANEIMNTLLKFDLQSLSDTDLSMVRETLNLKVSEADWIINGRKYHKAHFTPESNTDK